jgi:hypothetical protein
MIGPKTRSPWAKPKTKSEVPSVGTSVVTPYSSAMGTVAVLKMEDPKVIT